MRGFGVPAHTEGDSVDNYHQDFIFYQYLHWPRYLGGDGIADQSSCFDDPCFYSPWRKTEERVNRIQFIRLSVGIEDADDLIEDLNNAITIR